MRVLTAVVLLAVGFVCGVQAEELSIYDIQYTTEPNGLSPEDGNVVDCYGGIVIHKWSRGYERLILYDPNYADGWGGIQAKDLDGTGDFNNVNVGDWVSFVNVEVQDYKGTTFLQYTAGHDPNDIIIVSEDNPVPKPIPVRVNEIASPLEGTDQWVVADHNCEKYESMLIKVIDVNVKALDKGKADDNYILEDNTDPNSTCWASDYMNEDLVAIYHPYVQVGQNFCGVAGILEQYNGEKDGIYYDYYQLLTLNTESFTIEQTADLDYDCDVDFIDFSDFAFMWFNNGCTEPDWCSGADLTRNGSVDVFDLEKLTGNWLEGKLY